MLVAVGRGPLSYSWRLGRTLRRFAENERSTYVHLHGTTGSIMVLDTVNTEAHTSRTELRYSVLTFVLTVTSTVVCAEAPLAPTAPITPKTVRIATISGHVLGDFFEGLRPNPEAIKRLTAPPIIKPCPPKDEGPLARLGRYLGLTSSVHASGCYPVACVACYISLVQGTCQASSGCFPGTYNAGFNNGPRTTGFRQYDFSMCGEGACECHKATCDNTQGCP